MQHRSRKSGTGERSTGRLAAVAKIRSDIMEGRFAGGSQLPTFDGLVAELGLSRATMQLVIKELKDDGFVTSVHRSGLFAAPHPPHTHRFGLVFSEAPGSPFWNRFWRVLLAESAVVAGQREGVEIVPYFRVRAGSDAPDKGRLLDDVRNHRLAGVVVTAGTGFLFDHPEVGRAGVPCVGINHLPSEAQGFPVVNTADGLFMKKALAWLATKGRRRVAVLAMRPLADAEERDRLTVEDCASEGLETRPHWLCPVGNEHKGQVRVVVRLLLDYPETERPDCLIVATDNLVEEALRAIHESGVVVGRDIDVVAHCNWPWPVESPLPIARLGFHSHQVLNIALDSIRALRRGETPASKTLIPALFEDEL